VLGNDSDVDAATTLRVANAGILAGAHGTLRLAVDGGYTYTLDNAAAQSLNAGETVNEVFTYLASDGLASTPATLTIAVHGGNDAPVTTTDTATVAEDGVQTASGNVLANDSDVDAGAVLSVANPGTYAGLYGSLVLGADGSYQYTLDNASVQSIAAGDVRKDVFTYFATDGIEPAAGRLTITIDGANDAPVTTADFASLQEDSVLTAAGNVLANDSDVDFGTDLAVGAPGTYTGTYGTLELAADGSYSYTLDNASLAVQSLRAGQTVSEVFGYAASDGLAQTPGVLTISVTGANDAPVAVADFAAVMEDGPLTASGNVLANDSDIDAGTALSVVNAGNYTGAYGTLALSANGSYTYTLNNAGSQQLGAGQSVTDVFAYQASDGIAQSGSTLTVRISGRNDAPVTTGDAASVTEDTAVTASGNVLANDSDADAGTVLTVANFGTLTGSFGSLNLGSNGAYTYSLNNGSAAVQSLRAGETRTDVFTYQASDGLAQTPGTLTVTVNGTNDAPTATADVASLQEDTVLTAGGNVLANDSDIDAGTTLSVVNFGAFTGTYGNLQLNQNGTYTYTLNNASTAVQSLRQGQTVTDAFAYSASDGLTSSSASLTVTVAGLNDAPVVANPIPDQNATAGNPFTFTFAANAFTDIDQGDVLAYSAKLADGSALPSWLSFNAATRTFTGVPPGGTGGGGDCGCGDMGGGTASTLQIRVTAADQANATAFDDFALNVAGGSGGDGHSGQLIVGTPGNDVLTGTACDDVIDGREGYDQMSGGKGNDIYFVDQTCVTSGHGNEGVGNGQDDPPPGHDYNQNDGPGTGPGNPGSQGGAMAGDRGSDDNGSQCVVDLVIENANEGYDTVYASTDYTLGNNVEALALLGCDDLSGTGNALDNSIVGNPGDNVLNGAAGSDTLEGGEGDDTLTGGTGADTYVYSLGDGKDVIDEKGASNQTDTLKLQGIAASSVRVNKSGNDLVVDFPGRDGKVTIKNWFANSASRVEQFKFDDGTTWDETKIRSRVGKSVAPVYDSGYHNTGTEDLGNHSSGGQSSGGQDHNGDHQGDDGHHDEEDCRNDSDEAILQRLRTPAKFCFQDIMQAMGHSGPVMSAAEIARRWATVRGYFCDDGHCGDDHPDSAVFPSLKDLGLTVASHGGDCSGGFGYGGSTGSQHAGDPWFQCFNGLSDGFKKL